MIFQTQAPPTAEAPAAARPQARPSFQQRCACGGVIGPDGECETCKKRRLALQTRLEVSQRGGSHEAEAERIADQMTTRPADHVVSRSLPLIQRVATGSPAQRRIAPASVGRALAGSGRPLEPMMRQEMEERLGHDFSKVKVHTGGAAERSARDVNAHAYTVGSNIVFGARQFAPETQRGRRLLVHELVHVAQQTSPAARVSAVMAPDASPGAPPAGVGPTASGVLQRDTAEGRDPWDNLIADDREEVEDLYHECAGYIQFLSRAQNAHFSRRRSDWLNTFTVMLGKIGELDSELDIDEVATSFQRYAKFVGRIVEKFRVEWVTVEERYRDQRRWLLSNAVKSVDTIEAAKYLDELYRDVSGWLKRGASFYITDEEYLVLKLTLDKDRHLWVGKLRGARIRGKGLREMLEVVADLRRSGEDPGKYIPGWNDKVMQEAEYLEATAKSAAENEGPVRDYASALTELRTDLLAARQRTLEAHPREVSTLEKVGSFVAGAVGSVVDIFVETAKQAVDLVQISLHIVSQGYYEPKFISDMAAAAEQGATTGDLLKGMVTGLIETPSRFIDAVKAGDWKAIGRETVNLYLFAKAIKQSPNLVKNLPGVVAKTRHGLRILRARKVALEMMNEPRFMLSPPAPLPPSPSILTSPPKTPPVAPPKRRVVAPKGAPDIPSPARQPTTSRPVQTTHKTTTTPEPVVEPGPAWDLSGNPIPRSQLGQAGSAAGPDRVYVTPGRDGPGQVHVVRGGRTETFAETNRTLAEQQKRGFLTDRAEGNLLSLEEMKGKKVLDLAAGTEGRTVRELQARNIEASGMDIALSEQAAKTSGLRRADVATKVPFKEKFDIVYELYGGLCYGMGPQTGIAFSNAIARLKPGGTLYLAPLATNAQNALLPFVQQVVNRGGKLTRSKFHGTDEVWRLVMPAR